MKSRMIWISLAALLLLAGAAWAQVSPGHDLSWHVLAGGGAGMASAGCGVNGTLGQLAIGPAGGAGHSLGAGYWYGVGPRAQLAPHRIYLPVVLKQS
jgi:hypothetical protein